PQNLRFSLERPNNWTEFSLGLSAHYESSLPSSLHCFGAHARYWMVALTAGTALLAHLYYQLLHAQPSRHAAARRCRRGLRHRIRVTSCCSGRIYWSLVLH